MFHALPGGDPLPADGWQLSGIKVIAFWPSYSGKIIICNYFILAIPDQDTCFEEKKMLAIEKQIGENELFLKLSGRLDSLTAESLEDELAADLQDITAVTMDFEQLEYVSSAGLRVLLNLQQRLGDQGTVKLLHVNEDIMSVLQMTGFDAILQIE